MPRIKIDLKDNESVDRALKRFKSKFERTGVLREYRRRAVFVKPSVKRRNVFLRAAYKQHYLDQEN